MDASTDVLFLLLGALSPAECTRLERWVSSPYMNRSVELVQLCAMLLSKRKEVVVPDEELWHAVQPNSPYNDVRMRRYKSDLHLLVQRFIAFEQYEQSGYESIYLLQQYNKRNLSKHFQRTERALREQLQQMPYRSGEHHVHTWMLEKELDAHIQKNIKRGELPNIEASDRELDIQYLINKLKNYCDALNFKRVVNVQIPINLIDTLVEALPTSPYIHHPYIAIYYQILQMYAHFGDHVYFDQLLALLTTHAPQIAPADLRDMYTFAQNYCIQHINKGNSAYYEVLFKLYQRVLQQKTILDAKGELLPWDYKNIVTLGLRLKEFDWTAYFIENYNHYLPADFQQNARTYNLAKVYFEQRKYTQVLLLLREVEYQDIFYTLGSRWTLLKTYYELAEYDLLETNIESFRIYLLRNTKIAKQQQKQYLALLKYLQQLLRINPHNRKATEQLQEKIRSANDVAERTWLLQKLTELQ